MDERAKHLLSKAGLTSGRTNQRQLQSNRPGYSYVLNMPSWRRGFESTVPAFTVGEFAARGPPRSTPRGSMPQKRRSPDS